MSALTEKKKYTSAEYLALEEKAEFRSEFLDGNIIEMSGGTENHNSITLNIAAEFRARLRGKCRTHAIDVKVWIDSWNSFVYPDVFVVCGESNYYNNRKDILTNPQLIIEVLSDSTKIYDKGDKFIGYQTLESLKEYVLVDQDKFLVEQFTKNSDGKWVYQATIGQKSSVNFESLNVTLTLDEIYDLVDFEKE
jgi:Uma2 family endonuclease